MAGVVKGGVGWVWYRQKDLFQGAVTGVKVCYIFVTL